MVCNTAGHLPTRRRTRAATIIAMCVALLSAVAFGSGASQAQAAVDLLPTVGFCGPGESNSATDWGPPNNTTTVTVDSERTAVACLINQVRINAAKLGLLTLPPGGVPSLRFCTGVDGTRCLVPASAASQKTAGALSTAAQWKAMDVGYMCATSQTSPPAAPAILDPHTVCNHGLAYWPQQTGVTGWTALGEVLNVGYPSNLTPRQVVASWLNSQIHKSIILDPRWTTMGTGVSPAWYGLPVGSPYNWPVYRQLYSAVFINTPIT